MTSGIPEASASGSDGFSAADDGGHMTGSLLARTEERGHDRFARTKERGHDRFARPKGWGHDRLARSKERMPVSLGWQCIKTWGNISVYIGFRQPAGSRAEVMN